MILAKLPHFQARDGSVFFLDSARPIPKLSDQAMTIFEDLGAEKSVADISAQVEGDPQDAIAELVKRGVCTLIHPVDFKPGSRRKVLILEPHCDDAALSIGGHMWNLRETHEFTTVTLGGRSNYSSSFHTGRPFFVRDVVSELRRHEGELFMRHFDGDYRALDLSEATLRYEDSDWSKAFFDAHRTSVAISNNRQADPDILEKWADVVEQLLQEDTSEELWIPLGAGSHCDHDLTRNAILKVLMRAPHIFERYVVRFYEDVPYGVDAAAHTKALIHDLTAAQADIVRQPADITDVYDKKIELLSIFASQFKVAHVQPAVERSSLFEEENGKRTERLWHLKQLPQDLTPDQLFHEAQSVSDVSHALQDWVAPGDSVARVRVLLLAPSGRWSQDQAWLKRAFPNAKIDVFASPSAFEEVAQQKSADITLTAVPAGGRAWAMLALRLAFAGSAQTLFVAGDRLAQAKKLTSLWLTGKALVVPTIEHAALAFRRIG